MAKHHGRKSVVFCFNKPYCETQGSIIATQKSKITPDKKKFFIFEKRLDFLSLLWYCCMLTGGMFYEKYDKRAMVRKHYATRGQ